MKGCRPLTDDEVASVLARIRSARDRALFLVGVRTGFRISELLSLTVADVYQNGKLTDRISVARRNMKKKREGRTVALHPEAREALRKWVKRLRARGHKAPETFVFRSREGGNSPITRKSAWRMLKAAYAAAGLTGKLGTHTMRKTFAKRVHKALGNDLLKTQKALGHASVESTVSYLDVDGGEIEDAILKS
jgi:integrase